ncbi:MAG: hypothetical protein Q4A12_03095 [Eubacteriales bacterium]|nr:hypothetical protein [Eubacteriales bacterium]
MKKLIPIFGAFAIICVIISTLTAQSKTDTQNVDNTTQATVSQEQKTYMVKSQNGRIVVMCGDELYYRTTTAVSTLPKKDQKILLYGIKAQTLEEVELILRDYCS